MRNCGNVAMKLLFGNDSADQAAMLSLFGRDPQNKELLLWSKGIEEGRDIHQNFGGDFNGTCCMTDSLLSIITENEWIGS